MLMIGAAALLAPVCCVGRQQRAGRRAHTPAAALKGLKRDTQLIISSATADCAPRGASRPTYDKLCCKDEDARPRAAQPGVVVETVEL